MLAAARFLFGGQSGRGLFRNGKCRTGGFPGCAVGLGSLDGQPVREIIGFTTVRRVCPCGQMFWAQSTYQIWLLRFLGDSGRQQLLAGKNDMGGSLNRNRHHGARFPRLDPSQR
jgi:hypothetical protein